jgi:hypothetical protein
MKKMKKFGSGGDLVYTLGSPDTKMEILVEMGDRLVKYVRYCWQSLQNILQFLVFVCRGRAALPS